MSDDNDTPFGPRSGPPRLSNAEATALRARYVAMNPKLAPLFDEGFAHSGDNNRADFFTHTGHIADASSHFSLADACHLTQLASEVALDDLDDATLGATTLHALHALLRLGRAAGPLAFPLLAVRASRTSMDRGDYVAEVLNETLICVLTEMGVAAVPSLLHELRAFAGAAATSPSDAWRLRASASNGCMIVADSLLGIALESDAGDATAIARALLLGLNSLNTFRAAGRQLRSDQDLYRCVMEALTPLLPLVRTADTLAVLRDSAQYYRGGYIGDPPKWAEIFGAAGVALSSRDPLFHYIGSASGKHALSDPFPGQPGYVLSERFMPLPGCGWWQCRGGGGSNWGEVSAAGKLCGACYSARFCSARCQKAAWNGCVRPTGRTPLDPALLDGSSESGALWRLAYARTYGPPGHKEICRLIQQSHLGQAPGLPGGLSSASSAPGTRTRSAASSWAVLEDDEDDDYSEDEDDDYSEDEDDDYSEDDGAESGAGAHMEKAASSLQYVFSRVTE